MKYLFSLLSSYVPYGLVEKTSDFRNSLRSGLLVQDYYFYIVLEFIHDISGESLAPISRILQKYAQIID